VPQHQNLKYKASISAGIFVDDRFNREVRIKSVGIFKAKFEIFNYGKAVMKIIGKKAFKENIFTTMLEGKTYDLIRFGGDFSFDWNIFCDSKLVGEVESSENNGVISANRLSDLPEQSEQEKKNLLQFNIPSNSGWSDFKGDEINNAIYFISLFSIHLLMQAKH